MAIAIDACAAQHQGDRKEQQDRVVILPHARRKGVALAVAVDVAVKLGEPVALKVGVGEAE